MINRRTWGWTIASSRLRLASSRKTTDAKARRLTVWSSLRIDSPNALTTCRQASRFGSMTSRAMASASRTTAPKSLNIAATVLLPVPSHPVTPITTMRIV